MSSGRNNKLTGQIGEYLVCAELGRRGLIATPFAGNVPTFDVLATDELCRTVPIQVKASRGDVWPTNAGLWMDIEFDPETNKQNYRGPRHIENPELIYICVSIALPASSRQDRFFILTKADLQTISINNYVRWMDPRDWKRPRNPLSFDNRYNVEHLQEFEDNWELVIRRLSKSTPNQWLTSTENE